jgi:hypothetical protein
MKDINKIVKKYSRLLINVKTRGDSFNLYCNKTVLKKLIKEIELETLKEHCAKCNKMNP